MLVNDMRAIRLISRSSRYAFRYVRLVSPIGYFYVSLPVGWKRVSRRQADGAKKKDFVVYLQRTVSGKNRNFLASGGGDPPCVR